MTPKDSDGSTTGPCFDQVVPRSVLRSTHTDQLRYGAASGVLPSYPASTEVPASHVPSESLIGFARIGPVSPAGRYRVVLHDCPSSEEIRYPPTHSRGLGPTLKNSHMLSPS